ncbi:MAG: hypothetical protein WBM71_19495 [Sedimenticolaceae bacterium]|jgi:hypothetical protein
MSLIARFALGAALLATFTALPAAQFAAETYHDANCTRCHDTGVYTREDRAMGSYQMLESRVAACDARFGEELPADGLPALVDYLNTNYYKFEK